MKDQLNVVSFSGGKDSTALILWASENLTEFQTVFMDTGYEHPLTYSYVDYIDVTLLGGKLIRLKSAKYEGFEDLVLQRGRVPSAKARFCTQELKIFPILRYLDSIRDKYEIHNYVGIRAEESPARAKMPEVNFDLDFLGTWIHRPLLSWSAADVFKKLKEHSIEPNPLYKLGMKRVGCKVCIFSNLQDMKQIIKHFPETIDEIRRMEDQLGSTYFPPGYIPAQYCSRSETKTITETVDVEETVFTEAETKTVTRTVTSHYPTVDDVVAYVMSDKDQLQLFDEPTSCVSHYRLCE